MSQSNRQNCYARLMATSTAPAYDETMETEQKFEFQSNIVKLRCRAGMTQEQLAGLLGVSRNAIAKWEAGNGIPCVRNLITLSRYFHVSMDTMLLGDVDTKGE